MSKPQQTFKQFWHDEILKSLEGYGYNLGSTLTFFVVVSSSHERYGIELLKEVSETLNSGFSIEEAKGLIASEINSKYPRPEKEIYAGYCLVPELKDRLRVSLWGFNHKSPVLVHGIKKHFFTVFDCIFL